MVILAFSCKKKDNNTSSTKNENPKNFGDSSIQIFNKGKANIEKQIAITNYTEKNIRLIYCGSNDSNGNIDSITDFSIQRITNTDTVLEYLFDKSKRLTHAFVRINGELDTTFLKITY